MRLAATRFKNEAGGPAPDANGASGPLPLVIAHGLFGSARNWTSLARRFAATRPVITIDLRNHGESPWGAAMDYQTMADDLLETLAAEVGGRAIVLGHSMGGKVAMAAALAAPERIAALVVADIAPVVYDHDHGAYLHAMRTLDLDAVSRRSDADAPLAQHIPEPELRAFILQNLLIEDGQARWRLNLAAIDAAMADLTGWPTALEPSALSARRYDGPSLFYAGGASPYVDAAAEGRIRLLFPSADVERLPDAGHWLHFEQPIPFYERVAEWISRAA